MRSSPLTLREAAATPPGVALALVALLLWLYSVVIAGHFLLGLAPGLLLLGAYFCYRVLSALDRVADGVQRLADARESGDREGSDRVRADGSRSIEARRSDGTEAARTASE